MREITIKMRTIFLKCLLPLCVFLLFVCDSDKDITSSEKIDIGKGFLMVLPLHSDDFFLFVNLGHLNQPGHTFPSDHGGFYLSNPDVPKSVFCPGNMTITRVSTMEYLNQGISDFTITLSVNDDEFIIVFGHLSGIHHSILSQIDENTENSCETYQIDQDLFRQCLFWVNIPVSAGDTLGTAGGGVTAWAIDFGVFDKNRKIEFASDRWEDSLYPHTVSPLDYFTDEICQILIPVCGDFECGQPAVRTIPPIGGTIDYDVPGTAQGLWFRTGNDSVPEYSDIALIYSNVDPNIPIFSVGLSFNDLEPNGYRFTPQYTGYENRLFDKVRPDGHIYIYTIQYGCTTTPDRRSMILLELLDETHMKIENQRTDAGPLWQFTENALYFER